MPTAFGELMAAGLGGYMPQQMAMATSSLPPKSAAMAQSVVRQPSDLPACVAAMAAKAPVSKIPAAFANAGNRPMAKAGMANESSAMAFAAAAAARPAAAVFNAQAGMGQCNDAMMAAFFAQTAAATGAAAAAAAANTAPVPAHMPTGMMNNMSEDAMMAALMAMAGGGAAPFHSPSNVVVPQRPAMPNPRVPGLVGFPGAVGGPRRAAQASPPGASMAQPTKSRDELKQELQDLCVTMPPNASTRELHICLQEAKDHVARAKKTRNIRRHMDQELLKGFREGWFTPGPEALVKQLEAGADPNVKSEGFSTGFAEGMSPLLAAAGWGKPDEMRILLHAGADIRVVNPGIQNSALHIAAGGNLDAWGTEKSCNMIKLLLEWDRDLLFVKNKMGKTPLEWARLEKKLKQAKYITDNYPDAF